MPPRDPLYVSGSTPEGALDPMIDRAVPRGEEDIIPLMAYFMHQWMPSKSHPRLKVDPEIAYQAEVAARGMGRYAEPADVLDYWAYQSRLRGTPMAATIESGALPPPVTHSGPQGEPSIPQWAIEQELRRSALDRNKGANRAVLESILMPRPAGPGMGTMQRQRPRPVYDERGNVKGFDTRALGQRNVMKYLWPTETIRPGERPPAPTGR